jgi:hypothetical protein
VAREAQNVAAFGAMVVGRVIEAAWRSLAVANPTPGGSPAPTGDRRTRPFAGTPTVGR